MPYRNDEVKDLELAPQWKLAPTNEAPYQGLVLPGVLKITAVSVAAKPKRKGINPFTGQETVFAAKPATVKVKVRPMKKLKDAATA